MKEQLSYNSKSFNKKKSEKFNKGLITMDYNICMDTQKLHLNCKFARIDNPIIQTLGMTRSFTTLDKKFLWLHIHESIRFNSILMKKTQKQIAKKLNCSISQVKNIVNKFHKLGLIVGSNPQFNVQQGKRDIKEYRIQPKKFLEYNASLISWSKLDKNENCFTMIPHSFIRMMFSENFISCDMAILEYLIRYSVGMHKESVKSSIKNFCRNTGYGYEQVRRSLTKLENTNIVIKEGNSYSINFDLIEKRYGQFSSISKNKQKRVNVDKNRWITQKTNAELTTKVANSKIKYINKENIATQILDLKNLKEEENKKADKNSNQLANETQKIDVNNFLRDIIEKIPDS